LPWKKFSSIHYSVFSIATGTATGRSTVVCGCSLPSHSKYTKTPMTNAANSSNQNHFPISLFLRTNNLESINLANYFPARPSRYIGRPAMVSIHKTKSRRREVSGKGLIDRPIVLVGMMGVGKTSIGKKLAERLNLSFVDVDDEIEVAADLSITEIFERFGEDYFRDGERRVISRLLDGTPKVIATGGGAFINAETRAIIKQTALSIWLSAEIDVLVERVSRRNHRPLLTGKNPRDVLLELSKVRDPIYAEADIKACSDASPHAQTVEHIMREILK
jgi:shikimate kinase